MKKPLLLMLLFLVLAAAQAVALWSLPYSTSLVEPITRERAAAVPSGGAFRMGSVKWDIAVFASDPSLEVYREVYTSCADGASGLTAAIRISDNFARRFPHGAPRDEFFFRDYDPVRELYAHLGGEGGHCVTRAGLVSTTLLAVGIPARVLQVLAPDSTGHNIIEVWDDCQGWVVFDPTTGLIFVRRGSEGEPVPDYLSVADAALSPNEVVSRPVGRVPRNVGDLRAFITPRFFEGALIYPEPWLYTRVGERFSYWPFGGRFLQVGALDWQTGRLQALLRPGIGLCMLGSAIAFGAYCHASIRRLHGALASTLKPAGGVDYAGPTEVDRTIQSFDLNPSEP